MKINGYGGIADILKAYNSQKKQHAGKGREPAAAAGEDTLELSAQAREIQEMRSGLRDVKEVREEMVDRIKKEIEAGTYRVDAGKIADGIVKERLLDRRA